MECSTCVVAHFDPILATSRKSNCDTVFDVRGDKTFLVAWGSWKRKKHMVLKLFVLLTWMLTLFDSDDYERQIYRCKASKVLKSGPSTLMSGKTSNCLLYDSELNRGTLMKRSDFV